MKKSTNFLDYPKKLQKKIIVKAVKASNKEQRDYVEKFKDPSITYRWIYEILKRKTSKDYGSRCKEYLEDCPLCKIYRMLDTLEECVDLERELEELEK